MVHDGHAPGHAAVFFPHTGVLVAGDMLSDMEIPILATERDDALAEYRTGLDKLAGIREVRWLVPGHGQVTDGGGLPGPGRRRPPVPGPARSGPAL